MNISELRRIISKYSLKQLRLLVIELYKALPKSIREEKQFDLIVQNPELANEKGKQTVTTSMNRPQREKSRFTDKQGQYLSLIYYYTKIHGYPPAEADIQRHFKVSPPAVHLMIRTLEKRGLIHKVPKEPRTIRVLVSPEELPKLE